MTDNRDFEAPHFLWWLFVFSGLAFLVAAALNRIPMPVGNFPLQKAALIALIGLGVLHLTEAVLAGFLASTRRLPVLPWAVQTFFMGIFSLRLLLKRIHH